MLLECSKKNIAIVALSQTAVVLLGSVACRVVVRMQTRYHLFVPNGTLLAARWGWVALLVPAAWCVLAVYFFHRAKRPVMAEVVIPLTGLALAVLLAILAFAAALGGLFQPDVVMVAN